MRCTVTALGKLKAVSKYPPVASTQQWIGRDGSACGSPCGAKVPEAGSTRNALARCVSPGITPGPPLLETTKKNRVDGCGQAYWMLAGSVTAPRLTRAASPTSISKRASSGPTLAYKTVLGMAI